MTRMMCVYFTEPHVEGETFQSFPQHLTVMPWFQGEGWRVQSAISDTAIAFQAFPAPIEDQDQFGPNADIAVWLVGGLVDIVHELILRRLNTLNIQPESPEHTGNNFKPHITIKPDQPELRIGDLILIDHLAIVDELENKARRIARIINLRRV